MTSRGAAMGRDSYGVSDTVVGNYRIGGEIGRGSFAVVFKGVHVVSSPPLQDGGDDGTLRWRAWRQSSPQSLGPRDTVPGDGGVEGWWGRRIRQGHKLQNR